MSLEEPNSNNSDATIKLEMSNESFHALIKKLASNIISTELNPQSYIYLQILESNLHIQKYVDLAQQMGDNFTVDFLIDSLEGGE